MEKPIQRVAIYCRSCRPKSNELSDFQAGALIEQIRRNPQMELKQVYEDYGSDGRTQPSLARMMDNCKAGQTDIVLAGSLTRLSRDTLKAIQTIKDLQSMGIRVVTERDGLDTDKPFTELLLEMMAKIATKEGS